MYENWYCFALALLYRRPLFPEDAFRIYTEGYDRKGAVSMRDKVWIIKTLRAAGFDNTEIGKYLGLKKKSVITIWCRKKYLLEVDE